MRKTSLFAVLGAVMLVLQACSSSSTTSAPSASGAASASAAAPTEVPSGSAAPVTITVLEHQAPRVAVLNEIIPGFEAAMKAQGKDITVKVVDANVANDDEFKTKVTADYASGSPSFDITSYPGNWIPDFATAGYLADLTGRLAAWPDWSGHFYQILRDRSQQADGKFYSMPRHGTVMEFFLRKDVIGKLGVSTDQPTSWADLVDRLKEIHQKSGDLPALTLPAGKQWGGGSFDEGFRLVFLGTGGTLYDTTTKKWVVKSQALTDTFGLYATLQTNGLLPTKALLDPNPWEPTKYDGFTGTTSDGKTVPVAPPVTTQGSWGWVYDWGPAPNGARPIPDLTNRVMTWALPLQGGGTPYVFAAEDWMWAISAKSPNQDAAWEFLKYINTGEALAKDVAAVGNVAPRDDIQGVAPYSSMPYLIAMEKLLPQGKTFVAQAGIDKIQQAVADATEQILLGKVDGQGAADYFQKEATDLLGADQVETQ